MSTATAPISAVRPATVSWTIWAGVVAVTSASIGGAWDVAWHRSIGRDTFLTPAHIAIYLCGVIAFVVCAYLIFYTTFGHDGRLRAESVGVLGFRAPLGAFIAAWGGIAMLTSAPFDNWWHAAYGLDVKIISPPHTLLILGVRGVSVGFLFLLLAALNRERIAAPGEADTATFKRLRWLLLYMGGIMVVGQMFFLMEITWEGSMHNARPYVAIGLAIPIVFAVFARLSGFRWTCTALAAFYTLWGIAEILIFPLVPASPKLGPVYFAVTHLVPGKFPILLLVPAIALDLLWHRMRGRRPWRIALVSGVVFIGLLVAVEWPFATFLMSKASENRFFGTIYFDYNSRPDGLDRLRQFAHPELGAPLLRGLGLASAVAALSAWLGIKLGDAMRTLQR